MKLTEQQIHEMYPLEEVRRLYLARPDVAALPAAEQERRWEEHREKVREFYRVLAGLECLVINVGGAP